MKKIRNIIWQKSTRVIAFLFSCLIFAVCVGQIMVKYLSMEKSINDYRTNHTSMDEYNNDLSEEQQELFSELWVIGNMYLRNLDSNGHFRESGKLLDSTTKALRELGLMTEKENKITITPSEHFDYYVSWGDNVLSTDGKSYDEIFYSDNYRNYSTTYSNEIFHTSYGISDYYSDFKWYSTKYGMTYYDFPHKINGHMAMAVYDYDTSKLDYDIDKLGVKIYNKPDNTPAFFRNSYTTRVYYFNDDEYPDDDGYYDENGIWRERVIEEDTTLPSVPDNIKVNEDSCIYYDVANNEWIEIEKSNTYKGDESKLKICITPKKDLLYEEIALYEEISNQETAFTKFAITVIPFAIISVLLMVFFIVTSGYDTKQKKFVLSGIDRIWAEVVIAVGCCAFFFGMIFIMEIDTAASSVMSELFANNPTFPSILWTAGLTGMFVILSLAVDSIVKRFKCRSFWKTTLLSRIWKYVVKVLKFAYGKIKSVVNTILEASFSKDMKDNNIFARRFLIKLGIFILATLFSASIDAEFFVWLIIFAVYVYASLKDIRAITELSRQINDIYGGDYSSKEVHRDYPTYIMTEKLNNISDGIQTAVDKKLQSEKMKIELVTNVSHDLKTPLTSIISYINLLAMEDDLSPVAKDYVKILEQKSARLSEIVSDVFDIAKATSRTDINFEMIDAVILMEQVLGDMTDRIENSGKEIRKTVSAENAPVYADGKRLYRVLQNLIDNALKYSLDHTRIYLTLSRTIDMVTIKIKNISSYEIKFTPEEITERFTRGDESRTTDGSGLGLSIAKSFTEACGGTFEITIDGDVFEATVSLPIKEKNE